MSEELEAIKKAGLIAKLSIRCQKQICREVQRPDRLYIFGGFRAAVIWSKYAKLIGAAIEKNR